MAVAGCFREVVLFYKLEYGCFSKVALFYMAALGGLHINDMACLEVSKRTGLILELSVI